MKKDELQRLLLLYRQGTLEQADAERLDAFLQTEAGEQLLVEVWDKDFEVSNKHPFDKGSPAVALKEVSRRMEPQRPQVYKNILVAASILGLLCMTYWGYRTYFSDTLSPHHIVQSSPIVPGADKAIILLQDGTEINLEAFKGDTAFYGEQFNIYVGTDGAIVYSLRKAEADLSHTYNTIVTPKGGEYKLTLPDGSQVWLNADSELRYPVQFSKDARTVQLKGEAYFDVVKSRVGNQHIPFIVKAGEQVLTVLGTSFNLNSYEEATTTLVSGKVSLRHKAQADEQILYPNQKSVFDVVKNQYVVEQVDPYYITAWKDGKFAFDRSSLYDVMEQIARWYNIDVAYDDDFSDIFFSGSMSRFSDIAELLKAIEFTESIKFDIKGRRVTVQR